MQRQPGYGQDLFALSVDRMRAKVAAYGTLEHPVVESAATLETLLEVSFPVLTENRTDSVIQIHMPYPVVLRCVGPAGAKHRTADCCPVDCLAVVEPPFKVDVAPTKPDSFAYSDTRSRHCDKTSVKVGVYLVGRFEKLLQLLVGERFDRLMARCASVKSEFAGHASRWIATDHAVSDRSLEYAVKTALYVTNGLRREPVLELF